MALIEKLKNIANAIRSKTNKSEEMTLEQMASAILNIKSITNLQDKQVTITENGTQTIVADEGFEGLNSVEVTSDVWEGFNDDDADINAQLQDLNNIIKQMIVDAKNGYRGGLNDYKGYTFNPPFILKKIDFNGTGKISSSPFFYANILNINLDTLLTPTKFTDNKCEYLFAQLSLHCKRKINLGVTHDFSETTSAAYMFNNAYVDEIVWGSFVEAKKITNFTQMFYNVNLMTELDLSPIYTRSGTTFNNFIGYGGGYATPQIKKLKGIDLYNAESLTRFAYNLTCDIYADNWRLCDMNLSKTKMKGDAVAYIIEHACGESEGAVQRTLTLNAATQKNFQALENYEELLALASEKLITIA